MSTTPFLDLFRRGDVPREVRLLAAQGALAPRAHEQLELLTILVSDEDLEIAATADATLAKISPAALAAFLGRTDVSAELRAFFSARGAVTGAPHGADESVEPLVDVAGDPEPPPENEDEGSALQRLAAMTVPERVARAMKGSREERAVLVRDPNKLVSLAVLSSPKLTETEVERIARMTNVSEEVLRVIARTRAWVKNYQVVAALTKNPKTPVALTMNLLNRLTERDLRGLSTDRNIPEVVRLTARKKLVAEK